MASPFSAEGGAATVPSFLFFAAGSGLGYMISDAEQMQRVDVVMVGIFVIGLVGWALDALFRRVVAGVAGRRFPEVVEG